MAELTTDVPARAMAAPRRRLSEGAFAWLLISPALVFILVIVAWPLVETIRLSFTDARLGSENWIGLENYRKLFGDDDFYQIVGRTFDDLTVFRAGAAFEAATQPWKKRPAI